MNIVMKKDRPAVSIIIPTYNRGDLITRSINSVLNQSYHDFEVIIIDDCSSDKTGKVVEGISDKRITYYKLGKRKGPGAARNKGIEISNGEFMAFQDSDDEWLPGYLKKHMSVFERNLPNVGIVFSDMIRILKDGTCGVHLSPTIVPDRLINPDIQFYQVLNLGIQSTVIKKECFKQVGYFNERFPCYEDMELFIRLSKKYGFYHIKEPLVKYYETDGVSKGMPPKYMAREMLLKINYRELIRRYRKFFIKECIFIFNGKYLHR